MPPSRNGADSNTLATPKLASTASFRIERFPSSVRTQVLTNLRTAICELHFKPGQRLVERELIELCGVSRTSIREALRELAAEGLVTTIPNKGIIVAGVTTKEAEQIYELRAVLEGWAARLFVEHATNVQRRALRKAFERIEHAAGRDKGLLAAKDAFYDVLFAGASNEALRSVVSGLHARVSLLRATSLSLPGRPAETVAEIRAVLEAIEAGDSDEAAKRCAWHVEQAGRASIEAIALREDQ